MRKILIFMLSSFAFAITDKSYFAGEKKSPVVKKSEKVITKSLQGTYKLFEALYLTVRGTGYGVVFDKNTENERVRIAVKGEWKKVLKAVCDAADVWCDIDYASKKIYVRKFKDFVIDVDPEGKVLFGYGTSTQTEGESHESEQTVNFTRESNSSFSSSPIRYYAYNTSAEDFLSLLSDYLKIEYYPSPSGYIIAKLTPSQYLRVKKFFEEKEKREELIQVEVKIVRVDLFDRYRLGIDWDAIIRTGEFKGSFLGRFNPFTDNDRRVALITDAGDLDTVISALERFGKVRIVDAWTYQMKTGTPIPFANYRTVTYFTIGATQGLTSTQITAEERKEYVGFTGMLGVFKKKKGYYVEGYISLSDLIGFVVQQTPYGELKAPDKEEKTFRISTYLSDLNKVLIVGGFRKSLFRNEKEGVPLLSKIPVLGLLFGTTEDEKQNSEFVVLISLRKARELSEEELKEEYPVYGEPVRFVQEENEKLKEEREKEYEEEWDEDEDDELF